MINNAGSLFGLSLYEAMKNDTSRDTSITERDRETREQSNSDVGRQEKRRSKEKSPKARTTKTKTKKSNESEVLIMDFEIKGEKIDD